MTVRPATHADRNALGRVAHATGFFGAPADPFCPDRRLFIDLWIGPYLDGAGCCDLLADGGPASGVVGYAVGTDDLRGYRRHLVGIAPRIVGRALRGRYPQGSSCLPYLARLARYPARLAPVEAFPAQLHLNVLAEARGAGVGGRLAEGFLACLQERRVVGVQLSTTRENTVAIRLYEGLGFEVHHEYASPLWRPWLGRDLVHVVMAKRL